MDQKIEEAKRQADEAAETKAVTRADVVKMMVQGMGIVIYPDKKLRLVCEKVKDDEFDDNLKMLAEALATVMRGHKGIGISAPQVGIPLQLLIVNLTGKPEDNIAVANPRVIEASEERAEQYEGCLSFPNVKVKVDRPVRVTIEAESFEGKTIKLELKGLGARVVQHEMDHLEGVLLIDHETKIRRDIIARKMKKLKARLLKRNGHAKPKKSTKANKPKKKKRKAKSRS